MTDTPNTPPSPPSLPTPDCLSALAIDEWNAGDTAPELRDAHAAHLSSCEHCAARLAEARAEAERFLQGAPTLQALGNQLQHAPGAGVQQQPAGGGRLLMLRRAAPVLAGALAAAAAVMLMLRPPEPSGSTEPSGPSEPSAPTVRSKGAAQLGLFVKRGQRVLRIADGDVVHPGEALRLVYSSERATHLSIWGSDGRTLQRYHPAPAVETIGRVQAGREVALDFAIELDDALGSERFYGVFCQTASEAAAIGAALALEPPAAPQGCTLDVVTLTKEAAP